MLTFRVILFCAYSQSMWQDPLAGFQHLEGTACDILLLFGGNLSTLFTFLSCIGDRELLASLSHRVLPLVLVFFLWHLSLIYSFCSFRLTPDYSQSQILYFFPASFCFLAFPLFSIKSHCLSRLYPKERCCCRRWLFSVFSPFSGHFNVEDLFFLLSFLCEVFLFTFVILIPTQHYLFSFRDCRTSYDRIYCFFFQSSRFT